MILLYTGSKNSPYVLNLCVTQFAIHDSELDW